MTDRALPVIAVVIPAYRVAPFIADVLARVPSGVAQIIVVDDASPDNLRDVLAQTRDERVTVVRHDTNRGVGAAVKTGLALALERGAEIVVKLDGDGQMDPALIPALVAPLIGGTADIAKGNRFDDLSFVRRMPAVRRIGNLGLSFLVKLASGYWRLFDPCNGFVALRRGTAARLPPSRLDDRYFFEISLLCEAYFARARVQDVPMLPVYGAETSSLNPMGVIPGFAARLVGRWIHRMVMSYFVRDFNVVSLFLLAGLPTLAFGVAWSAYHWLQSSRLGSLTSTGTVMIGVLAIVLGFQLVLQALVLDIDNEPGRGAR